MNGEPEQPDIIPFGQLAREAKEIEWVVQDLIAAGTLILLAGRAKLSRKSLTSLHMSKCIASGMPFVGHATTRRPVFYSVIEDGRERAARRAKEMGLGGEAWEKWGGLGNSMGAVIGLEEHMKLYNFLMLSKRPPLGFFWVVDPLAQVAAQQGLNENWADDMTKLLDGYRHIAQRTMSTIMIIHHFNKGGEQMRGSTALEGAGDGWVECHGKKDSDVIEQHWYTRDAPAVTLCLKVEKVGGHFVVTPASQEDVYRSNKSWVEKLVVDTLRELAPGTGDRAEETTNLIEILAGTRERALTDGKGQVGEKRVRDVLVALRNGGQVAYPARGKYRSVSETAP